MASRNNYSDRDMMRMQQDAAKRVREMQNRAKLTVDEASAYDTPPASQNHNGRNFRNWSTNPNVQRQRSHGHQKEEEAQERAKMPPPPPEPPTPEPPPPFAEEEAVKEPTTVIQDILGAIGLDDDRLLIIGLLLLLINAKADTTLILALMYLLI